MISRQTLISLPYSRLPASHVSQTSEIFCGGPVFSLTAQQYGNREQIMVIVGAFLCALFALISFSINLFESFTFRGTSVIAG